MSLLSFLRKNKQESASDDSAFYSRAEEESKAVRSRKRRSSTTQSAKGDAPVDPVLPEKKRARRRLIGAVALVLAAVIGLPMILDSEPKTVADDIAIQIPSKDKPVAAPASRPEASSTDSTVSASSSLDPKEEVMDPTGSADAKLASPKPEESRVALATPSTPATKPAEDKHAADGKKLVQEKPHSPAPAKSDSKTDAKAEIKPEPKQPSKPVEKITEKPADKSADKAAEAARAKALLEGKPDPTATEKKSSKFVIQVAALATKEKVNELQTRLKDAGIHSYTQKVATEAGDRTRIRVGPFANKDEAERIRAKIVKLGLNGTLVPA